MSASSWPTRALNLINYVIIETEIMGKVTVAAFKYLYLMGFFESYQEHLDTLESEHAKVVNQICNCWYFHFPVVTATSCCCYGR